MLGEEAGTLRPRSLPGAEKRIVDTETGPVGFHQGQGGQPPAGHLLRQWPAETKYPRFLQRASAWAGVRPRATHATLTTFQPCSSPALPPAGHSPPSHVQSHFPSHLKGKSAPHAVQAAVAASEKQLPGTCCLQDPVPALGFAIRVSQCSACRVDPILPETYGPVPHLYLLRSGLTPPKGLSPRSSASFSATSSGDISIFSALYSHCFGCCGTSTPS